MEPKCIQRLEDEIGSYIHDLVNETIIKEGPHVASQAGSRAVKLLTPEQVYSGESISAVIAAEVTDDLIANLPLMLNIHKKTEFTTKNVLMHLCRSKSCCFME